MAYKVEFDETEHLDLLKPALKNVLKEEADIVIVTADGDIIKTHKLLLSMFSRTMASILSDQALGEGLRGISVPATTDTVRNLVNLLEEGFVTVEDRDDLADVAMCGDLFGIDFKNLQLEDCKVLSNSNDNNRGNVIDPQEWIKLESLDGKDCYSGDIKAEEWEFKAEEEITKDIKLEKGPIKEEENEDAKPLSLETIDQDTFACIECGRKLKSLVKLQFHLLRKHSKTLKIEQKCPECDKVFKNRKQLTSHMIYHTNNKAFQCQYCEKTFYKSSGLKSHSLTHGKDSLELAELIELKKITCTECGKTLKGQRCLKSHMINMHSDEKPYKCEECGSCFKMATNLTTHKLIHSGRYECDQCNSRFFSRLELKLHGQVSCVEHGRTDCDDQACKRKKVVTQCQEIETTF